MKIVHSFQRRVKLDKSTGCLLYFGRCVTKAGYPYLRFGTHCKPETVTYSRYLYELVHGKLPPKHEVHHTCKTRNCLNLRHLEAKEKTTHKREHAFLRNRSKRGFFA